MSPSEQWLFETLNSMRGEQGEQHARLRSDMNAGFDALREEMRTLQQDQRKTDDRVLVMQTQRDAEAKQAAARAGLWATVFSCAFAIALTLFEKWFGKR